MDETSPAAASVPPAAAVPAELPGVGEVLSAGTTVTLDNAGVIIGIWAACHLPAQVLGFVVGMTTGLADKEAIKNAITNHDIGAIAALAAVGLLGLVLGMLGYATTILLAARAFRGQAIALGDLLVDGVGRMISVVFASLLVGVCIGFGTLLLIIPGLYLLFRLSMTVCATCAEGLDPLTAFRRSWSLTGGRFWDIASVLGALFVVGIGAAVALLAAGVVLRIVGSVAGAAGAGLAALVINLFQFVVSAWGTACMTKFYLELADRSPL
jgi:hypothetical protein